MQNLKPEVVVLNLPPREQKYGRVRLCRFRFENEDRQNGYIDQMGRLYGLLQSIVHDNGTMGFIYGNVQQLGMR